jgi:MYXO-CTERM domain-containing protein
MRFPPCLFVIALVLPALLFTAGHAAAAIVGFDGTHGRVLEVGDGLVGVFREEFFRTQLSTSGPGLAIAVASALAGLGVLRRRRELPPTPQG